MNDSVRGVNERPWLKRSGKEQSSLLNSHKLFEAFNVGEDFAAFFEYVVICSKASNMPITLQQSKTQRNSYFTVISSA